MKWIATLAIPLALAGCTKATEGEATIDPRVDQYLEAIEQNHGLTLIDRGIALENAGIICDMLKHGGTGQVAEDFIALSGSYTETIAEVEPIIITIKEEYC